MNFRPDMVVAFFELVSGILITKSVFKLHAEKMVRGVSAWPICFFGAWGWWNLYWYSFINAPYAWWCGIVVVVANTTWALQILYWQRAERKAQQPLSLACFHDRVKIETGYAYCKDCGVNVS